MKISMLAVAASAAMIVGQPAAAASLVYNLTLSDPSAGLGAGPYGTVTVTENGGLLNFSETLASGYRFHAGNANHPAFTFNLAGDPNVNITNLTAGFAAVNTASASDVSAPPFGNFFTGIACTTACGPGYGGGYSGTLSFTVGVTGSMLTLASLRSDSFTSNNLLYNVWFTTDVVRNDTAGSTGNVGATVAPSVPETETWAMLTLGFGAFGFALRRSPRTRRIRFA